MFASSESERFFRRALLKCGKVFGEYTASCLVRPRISLWLRNG